MSTESIIRDLEATRDYSDQAVAALSDRFDWLCAPAFVAALFCLASICPPLLAQNLSAGQVIGVIDSVRLDGDQYYVFGWACQQGNPASIDVHIHADRSAYETPPGKFVTSGKADLGSEAAVSQECRDSRNGKHRFKVALPNQILRTFQNRKLYVHGIASVGNVENAAVAGSGEMRFPKPAWPAEPPTPDFLDGTRVAVFDTAKDACEETDVPDTSARAFRDYKGMVHLIASGTVMRAGVGPVLETAKHNCQVVYQSHLDGNPAHFDDQTWLSSFYSVDGKRIVALGHMEYHGWEHPGMCASKTDGVGCWYNVDTFSISEDGGYHFTSPKPPGNFIVGLPYKYEINRGPEGYSIDTNIVKVGEWYYAMVTDWPWPPNCEEGNVAHPCLVRGGAAPIRTANILDPTGWRGWNGKDFNVSFVDPYRGPVVRPQDHIYAPVEFLYYVNAINVHEPSQMLIATLWDPWNSAYGPPGLYFTTSSDMIHWSKPELAVTQNQLLQRETEGNWSYQYFSLIDPRSTDPNFSTITDHPYLYYVRMDDDHPPYRRVLFRQRIKLGWLKTFIQKPGASSGSGRVPASGHSTTHLQKPSMQEK